MINNMQIPYQFTQDYNQNQQMKNLTYIKLAASIQGQISKYQQAFLQIASGEKCILRQNLLLFIKLFTCLDYFDFKSDFIDKIFQILVNIAKNNIHSDEFQIICLMLIRKQIQQKYLPFLMQLISQNQPDQINFSLCVLKQLLYNALEIMEGRKKGPKISSSMINDLCEKSFRQLRRSLQFYNQIDKENYFLICQHSLTLVRKFYTEKKITNLKIYENIWSYGVFNCQNQNPKVISAIFGIMVQLCSFRQNYIRDIQKSQNFNQIIRCSQLFILKCQQVNKFWHAYLIKRKNLLLQPINNLDSVSIALLFSNCFYHLSQSIWQIQEKLFVVDNYILLNELMVKMKSIEHISNLRKELNPNPQLKGIQQIMLDSFQALYTPIYKMKQKSSFFQIVSQIKSITRYILNNPQANRFKACRKFLNILPALKIIFIKCRDVVVKEQCIQTLTEFLFLFLSSQKSKCFQNLIQIICQQFLQELKTIKVNQREKIRVLTARVDKIIYSSIGVLQNEGLNKKNISSYVKCINSLIKIIFTRQSLQINSYIQKLIKIVQLRQIFYDEELHQLICFLIKSMPKTQNAINTFQCLKRVIIDSRNIPYLQLIFDFAETHYTNPQIMEAMSQCNGNIAQMCLFSPGAQSLLRNVSYNVMIQSVKGNLNSFESVIQGIGYVARQSSFRPKIYIKLVEIIKNQRSKLEMFMRQQKNLFTMIQQIILVMIEMIRRIVNTLQENNQCNKAEKSEICQLISHELFSFCYKFYNQLRDRHTQVYNLINQLKNLVNCQSLKDLPNIQIAIKLLMTAHTLLETESVVPSTDQSYMQFYKSIKILKGMGYPNKCKNIKIQDNIFLMSLCNKFMGAKLINHQVTQIRQF